MTNEPKAIKKNHNVREKIHENTKNMSEKEIIEYYANAIREIEETYTAIFRQFDKAHPT